MAGRRWTQLEDETLIALYGKATAREVGDQLGRTEESVWLRARILGLDKRGKVAPWTEGELENLRATYAVEPAVQIAKRLGRTPSAVRQQARVLGLDSRKTLVNKTIVTDYFDVIDTAEKAYILGLMAADGNVMASGRVNFGLHERDEGLVVFVRDRLAPGMALNHYVRQPFVYFTAMSRPLAAGLAQWGVVPRKSRILTWPHALGAMQRPFLLGYFDGDGSAFVIRNRYPGWNVCSGSERFLIDMKAYIRAEAGVALEKIYHRPSSDLYQVSTTGRGAYVLDQWLHQDGLGMGRKRIPAHILARYQE